MLILYFNDYSEPARSLATALGCSSSEISRHHFPDGEVSLKLPTPLSGDVLICQTLDQPNGKLIELLLAANTARRLGAARVFLVAPYLCYMRQDMEFEPGQAISQPIIGALLSDNFDGVFTVDAHLHDEWQIEVVEEHADTVAELAPSAIRAAGRSYSLNVRLDGDTSIGSNWAETH